MEHKRTITQIQERAIVLTKIIHSIGLTDVVILVGAHDGSGYGGYMYMRNVATRKRDMFGIPNSCTSGQALKMAKSLCEQEWIRLTNLCADMLGEEAWVDKKEMIIIDSFRKSKDGDIIVESADGFEYDQSDLWRKV